MILADIRPAYEALRTGLQPSTSVDVMQVDEKGNQVVINMRSTKSVQVALDQVQSANTNAEVLVTVMRAQVTGDPEVHGTSLARNNIQVILSGDGGDVTPEVLWAIFEQAHAILNDAGTGWFLDEATYNPDGHPFAGEHVIRADYSTVST